MTLRVAPQPTFLRGLKALPPDRQKSAWAAIKKFMSEAGTPSLRFRPLKGRRNHFIINSARGDRVILRKDEEDLYSVIDAGPHDNVYRRWDR